MRQGRPLRFLAAVVGGWTGLRAILLWPADLPIPIAPALAKADPPAAATARVPPSGRPLISQEPQAEAIPSSRETQPVAVEQASTREPTSPGDLTSTRKHGPPEREQLAIARPAARIPLAPLPARSASRWAGDLWLALRPGDTGGLGVGQLGGSQAGARVTYALDRSRRVALSARLFAPLRGGDPEAGLGIDFKPAAAPVHILLEHRFGSGGEVRPAATVVAGGSIGLPHGVRLDAYGQGGAVVKRGGFADGAAQLAVPLAERGSVRLEAGGGVWGAAQRGVARLDLGPSAALVLPVRGASMRLQLDYRLRVAGNARPGSGLALSLGSSF